MTRRKALARLGLVAATAYAVPAFTTLSTASASGGGGASGGGASGPNGMLGNGQPGSALQLCGPAPATNNAAYTQCMVDNGFWVQQ